MSGNPVYIALMHGVRDAADCQATGRSALTFGKPATYRSQSRVSPPDMHKSGLFKDQVLQLWGNSAICRPVAQHRTHRFPSNRQAGIYNLTTGHSATGTIIRETLRRPGPHPHRSVRASFDPTAIFMHHIDLIRSVTGSQYHTYSTANTVMYINMHISQEFKKHGITGGVFRGRRKSSVISRHGPNTQDDASS